MGAPDPGLLPDSLVADALELAWTVARMGMESRPPVPAPKPLQPLMRFAKLSPAARATIRRVLDADEEFRRRVAVVVPEEADIDRASWLFLHRPEGWADDAAAMAATRADDDASVEAQRADRSAARRIAGLEAALKRVNTELAAAKAAAERARAELTAERRHRREGEEQQAAMSRRIASLEGERDSARRRASDASAEARRLAETVAGLEHLRADDAAREEAVAELRQREDEVRRDLPAAAARTAGERIETHRALAEAATALDALGTAFASVRRALGLEPPGPADEDAVRAPAAPPRSPAPSPPRRRPLPLPPALFDDSPEAAEHLVRTPGVLVLIDGYNATLSAWAGLSIAQQRGRLVDAAAELAARTGAQIHIVFDGAEQPSGVGLPPAGRRAVRWSFSAPDVEADDVLLAMVDREPPERPVVVASSDGRVRDGVRARGANAISTPQLFGVLRRELR